MIHKSTLRLRSVGFYFLLDDSIRTLSEAEVYFNLYLWTSICTLSGAEVYFIFTCGLQSVH